MRQRTLSRRGSFFLITSSVMQWAQFCDPTQWFFHPDVQHRQNPVIMHRLATAVAAFSPAGRVHSNRAIRKLIGRPAFLKKFDAPKAEPTPLEPLRWDAVARLG